MKKLIENKWEDILSLLINQYDVSKIIVNTWIRTLKIYDVKDNVVYFYIDEKLGSDGIKFIQSKKYDIFLLCSVKEILDNNDIELVIDEKINLIESESKKSDSLKSALNNSNLNPRYTFDTFIEGDSNRHAYAICTAVADCPGDRIYNPLYLYGNPGLGKTHLMQSIAHYIIEHNPSMKVLYVTSETLTNDLVNALFKKNDNNDTKFLRDKYRTVDVLLIDDIQFMQNKDITQIEFFNIFNELYNNNKQIIISSDKPPKDLKTFDMRYTSRFDCGIPIDIHEPDYETRIAILKQKAKIDNITNIPEEVFTYIAENITTNVRELEGALNKISIYPKLYHESITLEKAKEELKNFIDKNSRVNITSDLIMKVVSEHLDVSESNIISNKRDNNIVLARHTVMYLCRNYTSLSLKSIGEVVGGKDHSTVKHGLKCIENKLNSDDVYRSTYESLVNKINPIN